MLLLKRANIEKLINDWGVTIIVKKRLMKKGNNITCKFGVKFGIKHRNMSETIPTEDSPKWLI